MKKELIILIGSSGSGKSTFAKRLSSLDSKWTIVSSDEYRLNEYGKIKWYYKPHIVFSSVENEIIVRLNRGENVVYDACNISFRRRMTLFRKLRTIRKDVLVTGVVFKERIFKCIKQDKSDERLHHVGALVILGMKFISFCNSPKLAEGFDYLMSQKRFLYDRYKVK